MTNVKLIVCLFSTFRGKHPRMCIRLKATNSCFQVSIVSVCFDVRRNIVFLVIKFPISFCNMPLLTQLACQNIFWPCDIKPFFTEMEMDKANSEIASIEQFHSV